MHPPNWRMRASGLLADVATVCARSAFERPPASGRDPDTLNLDRQAAVRPLGLGHTVASPASTRPASNSAEKPCATTSTSSLTPRGASASLLKARRCSRLKRRSRGIARQGLSSDILTDCVRHAGKTRRLGRASRCVVSNISEWSTDDCRAANTGRSCPPESCARSSPRAIACAISLSNASRSRPTTKLSRCFATAADAGAMAISRNWPRRTPDPALGPATISTKAQ
jgi:hypothetical protein